MDVLMKVQRSAKINQLDVGSIVGVHNGREYVPLRVREFMVGRAFGEFVASKTAKGTARKK